MNEYGKKVAKKMEDYMGDPESVTEEIKDIQNADEGVKVRGALAAGVAKSFNVSKNAEGKADEAHDVMESIISDGFDNAALEANFEQKLDDKVNNLQPEWTQYKDQTNQKLAEIVTNINSFKHLVVDGDWAPAIKAASQDNVTVLFPDNETFIIKSYLDITGINNLKWHARGAEIYDYGQEVILDYPDQRPSTTAIGIRFTKCTDLTLDGLTHNGDTRSNGGGRVSTQDRDKIKPQIDFYKCDNVNVSDVKIKGLCNPWGTSRHDDPDSQGGFEEMQWHYMRWWKCKNVYVYKCGITPGGGSGEIFGFAETDHIDFKDNYHFQGDAPNTFWSFVNGMDCNHVRIRDLKVQSVSDGSFMDIAGNNVIFEGVNIDYPNGKLIDITQEWGYANVPTGKVVVKNCEANVDRLAFTSRGDSINLETIEEVVLDNVRSKKENHEDPFITCNLIKKTIIKNLDIHNSPYVNDMSISGDSEIIDWQEVLIENVGITSDVPVRNSHTTIETRGVTEIKDSYINLDRRNYLSLRERQASHVNLKNSKNKVVFRNTKLENTKISIDANVYFYNCEISNCDFVVERRVDAVNPSIYFIDCGDIYFNNVDYTELPSSLVLFNFNLPNSTLGTLHLKNTNIIGKSTTSPFAGIDTKGDKVILDNVDINLERWEANRSKKRPLRDMIIFASYINNESHKVDILIRDSHIRGTLCRLAPGFGSGDGFKLQFVNSIFYNLEENGTEFNSITRDAVSGSYNQTKLRIKGCTFNSDNINYLDESTNFLEKNFSQNTQNFVLE